MVKVAWMAAYGTPGEASAAADILARESAKVARKARVAKMFDVTTVNVPTLDRMA